MTAYLETSLHQSVGRIVLNRPEKRNALTRDFIEHIGQAIDQLTRDSTLRVLVLEARGKAFCAGMDLGEMQQRAESPDGTEQWQRDSEVYADVLRTLYTLPIPTIAAVQGPVLAGGMGLVLACDLVIASESAFFMLPEPMRGITAAMVTPFLVHRIGAGAAGYLLLSGERITARQALDLGLCHDAVPCDDLPDRIDRLVSTVLTGSPSALKITKAHLQRCSPVPVLELLESSVKVSAEARETADAREGLAAFLEKRKPAWQSG